MLVFSTTLWPGPSRRAAGLILIAPTLLLPAPFNGEAATERVGANTNVASASVSPVSDPVDSHTKTKAGFLAAAGLVILSLLVLATGLALVRTFKQR